MTQERNPAGLRGIEFVEFCGPDPEFMARTFKAFGFSKLMRHKSQNVDYYAQNHIRLLLNREPGGFAAAFGESHGPSICSMGWRVDERRQAHALGGRASGRALMRADNLGLDVPAIYGIGDSLIYFVDTFGKRGSAICRRVRGSTRSRTSSPDRGFRRHRPPHQQRRTRARWRQWADFYKNVFGFTEVRYFDIRGRRNRAHVLRSAITGRRLLHPDQRGHRSKESRSRSTCASTTARDPAPGLLCDGPAGLAGQARRHRHRDPRHRRRLLRRRLRPRAQRDRGPRPHSSTTTCSSTATTRATCCRSSPRTSSVRSSSSSSSARTTAASAKATSRPSSTPSSATRGGAAFFEPPSFHFSAIGFLRPFSPATASRNRSPKNETMKQGDRDWLQ